MDLWFLAFPISGAVVGWLSGLIFSRVIVNTALARKKASLSEQLASYVSTKIVSPELILEKVAKPEYFLQLMPTIEHHIDDFLRNRLKTEIPMIGMMIGDRTISQLKAVFMNELEVIFPEVLNKYVRDLGGNFDFKAEITKKLLSIPSESIDALIYPIVRKILCRVGIIAGLITGLVNVIIHYLIR